MFGQIEGAAIEIEHVSSSRLMIGSDLPESLETEISKHARNYSGCESRHTLEHEHGIATVYTSQLLANSIDSPGSLVGLGVPAKSSLAQSRLFGLDWRAL